MHRAEFMDFFVCSGSLPAELVAGDVQDLQSPVMIVPVHLLDRRILGCEATASGGIDHHDDLAFVIRQIQCPAFARGNGVIVNHCQTFLSFI